MESITPRATSVATSACTDCPEPAARRLGRVLPLRANSLESREGEYEIRFYFRPTPNPAKVALFLEESANTARHEQGRRFSFIAVRRQRDHDHLHHPGPDLC